LGRGSFEWLSLREEDRVEVGDHGAVLLSELLLGVPLLEGLVDSVLADFEDSLGLGAASLLQAPSSGVVEVEHA